MRIFWVMWKTNCENIRGDNRVIQLIRIAAFSFHCLPWWLYSFCLRCYPISGHRNSRSFRSFRPPSHPCAFRPVVLAHWLRTAPTYQHRHYFDRVIVIIRNLTSDLLRLFPKYIQYTSRPLFWAARGFPVELNTSKIRPVFAMSTNKTLQRRNLTIS